MPIQRITSIPAKVQSAITQASQRTGTSFDYLLNTAKRESSLRTQAKSGSSSAAGLFQFVEGTWLKVVKEDGDRLGLSDLARNIHRTSSGKYYVPNSAKRREILALRHDPETSALVAAAYTEQNERYVHKKIGRAPNEGELYLAHFLGPGSAARMIRLAESQPDSPANRYFPAAAKANKSIFYDDGQPRSLAQVREILISSHVDGDNSDVRKSSAGAFDFGIMGGLIADTAQPEYSKGQAGSIGVWGGGSVVATAKDEPKTTASLGESNPQSRAGIAQDHRHAAQQYDKAGAGGASIHARPIAQTAVEAPAKSSQSAAANSNWISDAFGDD